MYLHLLFSEALLGGEFVLNASVQKSQCREMSIWIELQELMRDGVEARGTESVGTSLL